MNQHSTIFADGQQALGRPAAPFSNGRFGLWPLVAGLLALCLPTMWGVARESWSSEQGTHGPIVLATGLWLIWRRWPEALAVVRPGSAVATVLLLLPALLLYAFARITTIIEVEGFAMYGAVLAAAYGLAGSAALRVLWFPLLYLAFIFPPPESLVALVTQPMKIALSQVAVEFMYALGYPIAGSGATIQIGQYELLVAAACAGLNSLISLTAIGLFYVYIRHNANWRYAALLMLAIVPAAVVANLVRVIMLIFITYHFGDAAAQGFIHDFAGVTMFAVSLLAIFLVDAVASPLRTRLGSES